MNTEQYQPALDVIDLMGELKRLLVGQRQADRLICRYMADLADGMDSCSELLLAYGDVCAYVHARLGLSRRSIRERIRIGRALRELPLLDAALMSGELTYSRIREVTRVAKAETERLWLEVARRLSMRALELRVAIGSGRSPSPSRGGGRQADTDFENPMLDLPQDVLGLLKQAMNMVRAGHDHELTEAEAMAAVARAAIAHLVGSPSAERQSDDQTHDASSPEGTGETSDRANGAEQTRRGSTHRGSRSGRGEREPGTMNEGAGLKSTHRGSRSGRGERELGTTNEGAGLKSTHRGSAMGGARPDEPLSADEQLLLELIRSGGYWNAPLLQHATEMPLRRLETALVELELKHLIALGPLGALEARGGNLSRAG